MGMIRIARASVVAAALVAMVGVARAATPVPAASAPGDVKNFSLLDYRGKHYELRRTEASVVVLFFTGADCPIARQSAPKLKAIEDEFGKKGVAVWMVNATPENDPDEKKLDVMFQFGQFAPKK